MTLEEKLDLLGGVDGFFIRDVPRLNLPRLKMADGPVGVRNFGPATAFAGGVTLTATWNPVTTSVDLTWNAAVDEVGGERDVTRYVLFRRLATDPVLGDPYLSISPAGTPTYLYPDVAVTSGQTYVYGLAAQDCTPSNSTPVSSAPITVP